MRKRRNDILKNMLALCLTAAIAAASLPEAVVTARAAENISAQTVSEQDGQPAQDVYGIGKAVGDELTQPYGDTADGDSDMENGGISEASGDDMSDGDKSGAEENDGTENAGNGSDEEAVTGDEESSGEVSEEVLQEDENAATDVDSEDAADPSETLGGDGSTKYTIRYVDPSGTLLATDVVSSDVLIKNGGTGWEKYPDPADGYKFAFWAEYKDGVKTGRKYNVEKYATEDVTLYPAYVPEAVYDALQHNSKINLYAYNRTYFMVGYASNQYDMSIFMSQDYELSGYELLVSNGNGFRTDLASYVTDTLKLSTDNVSLGLCVWDDDNEDFKAMSNASDYVSIEGMDWSDSTVTLKTTDMDALPTDSIYLTLHVEGGGYSVELVPIPIIIELETVKDFSELPADHYLEGADLDTDKDDAVWNAVRHDLWFTGSTVLYTDEAGRDSFAQMEENYMNDCGEDWAFKYIQDFYEEREGAEAWGGDYMFYQTSLVRGVIPEKSNYKNYKDGDTKKRVYSLWCSLTPMSQSTEDTIEEREWVEDHVNTEIVAAGKELDPAKYEGLSSGAAVDALKARDAYSWVVNHVKYESGYNSNSTSFYYFAPAGFKEGKGSCECMAQCFYYLCRKLGVNCRILFNSSGHVYNLVQVGDDWYYTDCSAKKNLKGYGSMGTFKPQPDIMPTSCYDWRVFKAGYIDKVPKSDCTVISAEPDRYVTVSYDSDCTGIWARTGAQTCVPDSYTDQTEDKPATVTYVVEAGSTLYITAEAKDNCTARIVSYAGTNTKGTFKASSEVSVKPTENITVTVETSENRIPELYEGEFTDIAGETPLTAVKNTWTVNPEQTYTTRVHQGVSSTYTEGRITVFNGKKEVTESVISESETAGLYTVAGLSEYAGSTLTLNFYADASQTKPFAVYKLAVQGSGSSIKSFTLAGAKKNVISITAGTSKELKAAIKPANINTSRIYAVVDESTGVSLDPAVSISDRSSLILRAATDADTENGAELKVYYRSGDEKAPDSDRVLAEYTVLPEIKTYTSGTPSVKLANATDKELRLSLSLPRGVPADTECMYYRIQASAVTAKNGTVAAGMADRVGFDESEPLLIPVTAAAQYYDLDVSEGQAADDTSVKGAVQKYNVEVKLVLSAEDDAEDAAENILGESVKAGKLTASTKADAYASKLSVKKGNVKFYAGQATADATSSLTGGRGILAATVTYDSKATRHNLSSVRILGPDGKISPYFEVAGSVTEDGNYHGINEGGTTAVHIRVKRSLITDEMTDDELKELLNVTIPAGKYTIVATAVKADDSAKDVQAKQTFEILKPIQDMCISVPATSQLKTEKKALTIKPAVIYTDSEGALYTPAAKKVIWSYTADTAKLAKYITFNSKTGQLTIAGNYVLPTGACPTVTITAAAADYAGNSRVTASRTVTIKSSASKPAGISVSDGENVYGEGDSVTYGSDDLDDAAIVLKDSKGNVIPDTDYTFKSSAKAVTVLSGMVYGDAHGSVGFVTGQKVTKRTKVTITASASDGSGYSIKLNIWLDPAQ